MNFLQLLQRLKRKCRVSGAIPTTVTGLGEEFARLLDFNNEAWMDIQLRRADWKWMRSRMSFPTVTGKAAYELADIATTGVGFSNFGNWDFETFRCHTTAIGTNDEMELSWIEYEAWRNTYQIGATRNTSTRPTQFTDTPSLGIGLGCTPLAGYTITGDYYKVATEMSMNSDTPSLPAQFHMAIVYRAMMYYGVSEAKPEVYDEGENEFKKMMARIELQQLPTLSIAGALA